MKPIAELKFGFSDAESYRGILNRELFNRVFVRTPELNQLCNNNIYFLIGEKGTGKTAFAMYFEHNVIENTTGNLRFIRETAYQKFINLKEANNLGLTDYVDIWKLTLFLLIAKKINNDEKRDNHFHSSAKFRALQDAIDEYVNDFSPEIDNALGFVEKTKTTALLIAKHFESPEKKFADSTFTHGKFQTNLQYILRKFEAAIHSLSLDVNYILFIDGIDKRPESIPYENYLECIKGLANAVWSINNDFFSNIENSKGRLRTVLLMRPDIISKVGLHNLNTKIRDNSVLLDWRTKYTEYLDSPLFEMIDNLLSSQQNTKLPLGSAWSYYLPWKIKYKQEGNKADSSFISFLRFSLSRPRDIVEMLRILQENFIRHKNKSSDVFSYKDFSDSGFRKRYSDYLLGEIKEHLAFYHEGNDYELFLKFFTFMNGEYAFTYEVFTKAFGDLDDYMNKNRIIRPTYFDTADVFLQFLYESNVICYLEDTADEVFIRWCYRQRTFSNIEPKVKMGVRYEIHYALGKGLNVGKEFIK